MDEVEAELCVAQFRERQLLKLKGKLEKDAPLCIRASYIKLLKRKGIGAASAPQLRLGDDYVSPDDAGYKPAKVDSVLMGVARATGETATAVKRGKTITKHQYDTGEL